MLVAIIASATSPKIITAETEAELKASGTLEAPAILIGKEADLFEVSSAILVGVYNSLLEDKSKSIQKFEDRKSAVSRTYKAIQASVGPDLLKPEVPAPKPKKPAKGNGVIATMKLRCNTPQGATMDEIAATLAEAFPERSADSMRTTAKLNATPRYNNDKGAWEIIKENGKPTRYKYVPIQKQA